jgi:hypothetical protein
LARASRCGRGVSLSGPVVSILVSLAALRCRSSGLVGEAHQPPNERFVDAVTLHDLRVDVQRQARVGVPELANVRRSRTAQIALRPPTADRPGRRLNRHNGPLAGACAAQQLLKLLQRQRDLGGELFDWHVGAREQFDRLAQ